MILLRGCVQNAVFIISKRLPDKELTVRTVEVITTQGLEHFTVNCVIYLLFPLLLLFVHYPSFFSVISLASLLFKLSL